MPPHNKQKAENGGLLFLDGLRGLAAFYVMVGHARWLLWEGYNEGFLKHPASYSAFNKVLMYFFSLFRYGHEAVLFFFVLSGFVIHLRYARRMVEQGMAAKFDWAAFIWRRARRLYPPLLAAIGLALILDNLGKAGGFAIYNQHTPYPLINHGISVHLDGGTLLGNLAFVMDTYVPVFGCNGPLWSLKFEWWFYMIYPFFWCLTRRSVALAAGLMAALFAASFFQTGWPLLLLHDVFTAMLAWWLGAVLADIYAGRLKWRWHWVAVGAGLPGLLALRYGNPLHDLGMGLIFSAVLAGSFALQKRQLRLYWLEGLKPLGDMSYTLYVTHFPILVLAGGWLMSRSPKGLLPQNFGWVWVGIACTMMFAYGLHFVVERPFLSRAPRIKT